MGIQLCLKCWLTKPQCLVRTLKYVGSMKTSTMPVSFAWRAQRTSRRAWRRRRRRRRTSRRPRSARVPLPRWRRWRPRIPSPGGTWTARGRTSRTCTPPISAPSLPDRFRWISALSFLNKTYPDTMINKCKSLFFSAIQSLRDL